MQFISELKLFFLDSLFPHRCSFCYKEGDAMCKKCITEQKPLETQVCIECLKPSFSGLSHTTCKSQYSPDGLISVFKYEEVSKAIIEGKYQFIARIFEIFGNLVSDFLLSMGLKGNFEKFTVTSLPLSHSRQKWRGFNQSAITGNYLSVKLNLPYRELLERDKHKKSQKDLDRAERKLNVKNAFRLAPAKDVRGKNILLVDDVITTGSTLKEAVKTLKQNGAAEVWCITIARD